MKSNNYDLPEINIVFQMTKKVLFEVHYYRLGNNTNQHFSTTAEEFNQPKTDWRRAGQAQDDLLKVHTAAMAFYKKWDECHLNKLTKKQYAEMTKELDALKEKYNFIENNGGRILFSALKEFSKQTPKKILKQTTSK